MKEDLDQHFMVDKQLVKRIVSYAKLKKGEKVLEIGAGKGVLTKELAKKVKVVAVEKDESFFECLECIDNAEVHFADAVKFIARNEFDKVVGNVPYVISEPLLNVLKKKKFKLAVFTVGKKLADKLLGETETKLSIIMPLFFEIKLLEEVPKTSFSPRPKTDSAVIEIKLRKRLSKNDLMLKDFLVQEDKLAKNALRETLVRVKGLTKRDAKEKTASLKMNLDRNLKLLSYKEIKNIKEFILS